MHPIITFPNELLARVFRACATISLKEWKTCPGDSIPPIPLPMVLCAVNRHWNQLALSSPELWSTIYVPILVNSAEDPPRSLVYDPVKFTRLWLKRSQDALLDVYLRIPNVNLAFDLTANRLLPLIFEHSARIRLLAIEGDLSGLRFPSIRGIMTALSTEMGTGDKQLPTLHVKFPHHRNVRATDIQTLLYLDWDYPPTSPPQFTTRYLSAEGLAFNPTFFPNLVSLNMRKLEVTFPEFQALFTSLPRLRSLSLPHLCVLRSSGVQNPSPFVVSTLDSLSFSLHRRPFGTVGPYPINFLSLPNLRHLTLSGEGNVPLSSAIGRRFVVAMERLETLTLKDFVRFAMDSQSESTKQDLALLQSFTTIKRLDLVRSRAEGILIPAAPRAMNARLIGVPTPAGGDPGAAGSHLRRKRSFGLRTPSPLIAEKSRTLEGMFQQLRTNSSRSESDPLVPTSSNAPASGGLADSNDGATRSVDAQTGSIWPLLETISLDTMLAPDLVSLCTYLSSFPEKDRTIKTIRLAPPARRHLFESVKRRPDQGTFFSTNFFTRKNEWDALKWGPKANEGGEEGKGVATDGEPASEWIQSWAQVLPLEEGFGEEFEDW